ncbi:MAG: ATP-dependent DNA helicase [Desulfobacteraceae bacterium]|nr:ATP-dependent DNA helicase [Desulfobacteraceae bacterium]
MKTEFNISVRALVEYELRAGDLRTDFFSTVSAVEGIRAHQKTQQQRPDTYQAEVAVCFKKKYSDCTVIVSGRVDGIYTRDERTVIEEIKTSRRSVQDLEANPNPVHWGQAQCYAYLWALQENLDHLDVQLTYVDPKNYRTHELTRHVTLSELSEFFNDVLSNYLIWLRTVYQWRELRNNTISNLGFPYVNYRSGQRSMAVEVYRAFRDKVQLFVQAPTGIGKTMAALFPSVKALGEQLIPKVIFLTARTTGRIAAEKALDELRARGAALKALTLTAKDKICFNPESACLPEECEFSKGFYDRINQAVSTAFSHKACTREVLEAVARKHSVCPFELSLELITWVDCLIGDYNYAFDPTVTIKRLFLESGQTQAVLVDEAHNLVDRAREMFSAVLKKQSLLALTRLIKDDLPGLHRQSRRLNKWLSTAENRCRQAGGSLVEHHLPDNFIEQLQEFTRLSENWLRTNIKSFFRDELARFFFDCLEFLRAAEQFDQSYAAIYEISDDDFTVKLFCLDPARQLRQIWQRCRASVFFSATLAPATYFQSVFGCTRQIRKLNLPSPFPPENLSVLAATRISTFYHQRKKSCNRLSRTISDLVLKRRGNYLLFFPSYAYMNLIYDRFCADNQGIETIVQTPAMSEKQRETFINLFQDTAQDSLVGFAVMGGVFGEGIDLKGERLTGAVIVGVGLPGISLERELIKDYYEREDGAGFDFAYRFPGMIRVLQAAGRVIRSEQDKGVVLLIDQRYGQTDYKLLLPAHWHVRKVVF